MIAALFVERDGVYSGLPDVDVWDEARDARLYEGPWPVVAHPPCARWCQLAGLVQHVYGYKIGDDGGCFEAALEAVRRFGGVLEHPAHSLAWAHFGLSEPLCDGWNLTLDGSAVAHVEQERYGHPARKPTWLYAYGVELPSLRFGRRASRPDDPGWWVRNDRSYEHKTGDARIRGSRASATPTEFRDVLLGMARVRRNPKPHPPRLRGQTEAAAPEPARAERSARARDAQARERDEVAGGVGQEDAPSE